MELFHSSRHTHIPLRTLYSEPRLGLDRAEIPPELNQFVNLTRSHSMLAGTTADWVPCEPAAARLQLCLTSASNS